MSKAANRRSSDNTTGSSFGLGIATPLPLLGAVPAAAGTAPDLVYVNTWKGSQIYGAWFDPARGDLTPIGPVGDADADWAVRHPTLPVLYVATMEEGGVVYAFGVNRTTGARTRAPVRNLGNRHMRSASMA